MRTRVPVGLIFVLATAGGEDRAGEESSAQGVPVWFHELVPDDNISPKARSASEEQLKHA